MLAELWRKRVNDALRAAPPPHGPQHHATAPTTPTPLGKGFLAADYHLCPNPLIFAINKVKTLFTYIIKTYGSEVKGSRARFASPADFVPPARGCECDVWDAAESFSKIDIGRKTGIPYSSLHTVLVYVDRLVGSYPFYQIPIGSRSMRRVCWSRPRVLRRPASLSRLAPAIHAYTRHHGSATTSHALEHSTADTRSCSEGQRSKGSQRGTTSARKMSKSLATN